MASVILYCRGCNQAYVSVGELPAVCPSCEQPTKWSTVSMRASAPTLPLSVSDRTFLRSLRIAPQTTSLSRSLESFGTSSS